MPRLSDAGRKRREAADGAWLANDADFPKTAAELASDEQELRRWASRHDWYGRSEDDQSAALDDLKRKVEEGQRLLDLANGRSVDGKPLYVPTEMRLGALWRVIDLSLSEGGEHAEVIRAGLRGMVPGMVMMWARVAKGVNSEGEPVERDIEVRAAGEKLITVAGLASSFEIRTFPWPELAAVLRKRSASAVPPASRVRLWLCSPSPMIRRRP